MYVLITLAARRLQSEEMRAERFRSHTCVPSGLKTSAFTFEVWPFSLPDLVQALGSHILMKFSVPPLTSNDPSGVTDKL